MPGPNEESRDVTTIGGVGLFLTALFIWGLFQTPVFKSSRRER